MLISEAYAQAGGGTTDMLTSLLPLVLIFVVFYFLLIRPQQKKMKDHKAMIEAVRRGDTVTTSGGIIGKVTKVQEDGVLQIEIAEGVKVKVVKGTITEVRAKGAEVDEGDKAEKAS
ncbi:preprotein translocase subunit YajC [Ferrovibrio xuzhouensis]|uniref:Sec translocon accessory complex subunit YajC n=1 Tax=Ferrovibrio xuzhouensis TaxID=1576914 RepID=A0ABV7VIR8_9PROT